jgi:hypothetical protein
MVLYIKRCIANFYKYVIIIGMLLYTSVPINIEKLQDYKPYIRELKPFLIKHVFDSVEEFLCYWFDAIAAGTEYVYNSI